MKHSTALGILLGGSIDYAGLFPPAALGMATAVDHFAHYRRGDQAWMLGRCILPVHRLGEWSSAEAALPEDLRRAPGWRLATLAGEDLAADVDAIAAFNGTRTTRIRHVIDTIEFRADGTSRITEARRLLPPRLRTFVEIPIEQDPERLIEAIAGAGFHAKARTGGISPDAFPSSGRLARFIRLCARTGTGFKVTAGLHHPLRGCYPLTYEPGSATGVMFGFLNVLLAAGVASSGGAEEEIRMVLEETDGSTLLVDESGISWKDRRLSAENLAATRGRLAFAFGSCSFTDPVHELQQMGLL